MRISRLLIATAACLGVLASHGLAADAVLLEPAPEVVILDVPDWSGLYIAGVAGYESTDATLEHQNVNNFGGPGGEYWHDGDGFVGGVEAGYDHQFAGTNIVLGAALGIRSGTSIDDGGEWEVYHNRTESEIEYVAVAKARLGYAITDRFLPYVTAGWAGGNVKTSQDYSPPDAKASTTWEDDRFASGYVVGAGVDVKVTESIFVGLEYNYTDLGKVSFSGADNTSTETKIDADLDSHSLLARVGFRF